MQSTELSGTQVTLWGHACSTRLNFWVVMQWQPAGQATNNLNPSLALSVPLSFTSPGAHAFPTCGRRDRRPTGLGTTMARTGSGLNRAATAGLLGL